MKTISAQSLFSLGAAKNGLVVDVRTPDEYAYEHIHGSINIPIDKLSGRKDELPREQPIYIVCQSGLRSRAACEQLNRLGLQNIMTVEGGIKAFEKAGGQLERDTKTLPLMRQVQIAAGSLMLLGILLSKLVHPGFLFISLFVGAGLVFAGISGFCGMALLLGKMPWNKNKQNTTSCSL